MANSIKVRAKAKDGIVTVKALMSHPMETGLRKNSKTGKKIPAHYIKEVIAKVGGNTVMEVFWGTAVSKNPYLSFKYSGGEGDELTMSWVDNQGDSGTASVKVK
ncbi:MAG: thiosulfate oxidation carrier complex protein SoxZ [Gammaproteobacteria bacterium]|nr:thiosulfate oxidation carrier complex protein SoxZ [Gammaproteobacteria bacterium]